MTAIMQQVTTSEQEPAVAKMVGTAVRRREDPRLLTGRGCFIDDIKPPGVAYAAILRSPYAHARIRNISVERAARSIGVIAVLTGADVAKMTLPRSPLIPLPIKSYPIAVGKVRYVGEPVAVLAAETKEDAQDALDLIEVDYEPLKAVVDAEAALAPDAPVVYDELGSNLYWHGTLTYGDLDSAFGNATHKFEERITIHRYSSAPLEPHGCIAHYEPASGLLTVWVNTQSPGRLMETLTAALRMPGNRIRLRIPADNGGGFGIKTASPYAVLISLLSMVSGRPVKYIEGRQEHLQAGGHSCDQTFYIEAATTDEGVIEGLRIKEIDNEGASGDFHAYYATNKLNNFTNTYRVKNISLEAYSVATNKCPVHANRGVGKPAMCLVWERMVDIIGRRLGIDPVTIRMRNYVLSTELPYRTPNGNLLDSGNYSETLRVALEKVSYDDLRSRQAELRKNGQLIGIGISTGMEPGGSNFARHYVITGEVRKTGATEGATLRVDSTGKAVLLLGTVAQGHGYETTAAQIVADELGVDMEDVYVEGSFDSFVNPWTSYSGAWGNNFSTTGVGAIVGVSRRIKEKVLTVAASLLGESAERLYVEKGVVRVIGEPTKSITFREVASASYNNPGRLPGIDLGLQETYYFTFPYADVPDEKRRVKSQFTHANSAHVAVVSVDKETGATKVLRYVVVADCGKMVNPMIVKGQTCGATSHGIAATLIEEIKYDDQGQLLSSTYMDYFPVTAQELPTIEVFHRESPSPFTSIGTKGVGEGGAILAPAAICNAVEDALEPFGVKVRDLPLTPERVWTLIHHADKTTPIA